MRANKVVGVQPKSGAKRPLRGLTSDQKEQGEFTFLNPWERHKGRINMVKEREGERGDVWKLRTEKKRDAHVHPGPL